MHARLLRESRRQTALKYFQRPLYLLEFIKRADCLWWVNTVYLVKIDSQNGLMTRKDSLVSVSTLSV